MNTIFKIFVLVLFLTTLTFAQNKMLRADGTKIVDGNGEEIIFRGIGMGGWLVPEGYMFNMAGFANSPTEIEAKVQELVGEVAANEFWDAWRKNFVTKSDIDSLKAWGFNMFRLPMHYKFMTPKDQPYVYDEYGFELIDSCVAWCKANDMYVILDLHAAPGGQSAEPIADYVPGEPALWESEENQLRTVDLWREIASRYKDEEYIGAYDILNEPAWSFTNNNKQLRDLLVDITEAIRTVDTNHIIFVEGNWFATDFTGLTPKWDDNMGYSFHKYWSAVDENSVQGYVGMSKANNCPLWMSESGENSNAWFTDYVELLEENNIGWTWWTHKKFDSISSFVSVPVNSTYRQVHKYWDGSGGKPSVDLAKAGLMLQAENLKIENSRPNYQVHDALLRQPFDKSIIPVAENKVPGLIFASDYDLGTQGYAYYDVTPENVGGSAYNNGWVYRNDGVDLESCSDFPTNGYNVGWTDSGEYLKFTIDVETSGTYDLHIRVAGQGSDGKIQIMIDGIDKAGLVDVPNTGGWQTWQTLTVKNIEITQGKHELMTRFFFGGFNVNSYEFELKTVGVEELALTPEKFELKQNSPNPFNPTTNISFSLPVAGYVTLDVYDILGRKVSSLVNMELEAGNYTEMFNANGIASGIYVYTISVTSQLNNSLLFRDTQKMVLMK